MLGIDVSFQVGGSRGSIITFIAREPHVFVDGPVYDGKFISKKGYIETPSTPEHIMILDMEKKKDLKNLFKLSL